MTARYDAAGKRWGATVVKAAPMTIIGKRTKEKDGYNAAIVKVQDPASKKVKIKEIRGEHEGEGQVKLDEVLKVGDVIKVSGVSKGHGFTGVVKRYGFAGGPRTHGQSDRERARGSSGSTTTPGRVFRGKRMAGRMGNQRVTVKNLQVLEMNSETGQIVIKGSLPGSRLDLLEICK